MKLNAEQVYNKLLNEDKILSVEGQIRFVLGDVDIVVKQRDVVGNIIQEWLEGWMLARGVDYTPNPNSQMPPDIYLDSEDRTINLLEVKAFNYRETPAFDIADFNAFQQEIITDPYMLNADYLIFGYDMDDNGVVVIKDLWLKKVWEICRPMAKWALNLQIKRNVVHKIRPAKWYGTRRGRFLTFDCLEDFLAAVEECVYQNTDTRTKAIDWKSRMIDSYKRKYNVELLIPRWYDIRNKYVKD